MGHRDPAGTVPSFSQPPDNSMCPGVSLKLALCFLWCLLRSGLQGDPRNRFPLLCSFATKAYLGFISGPAFTRPTLPKVGSGNTGCVLVTPRC